MEEDKLNRLHQAIVAAVSAVKELGLTDENDMTTLFPADKMKYGLGTDIIVEITGLDDKPERTLDVLRQLAKNAGRIVSEFFPDAKIECFVHPFNHDQKGFWSTHE
jgi:hypothetical protein